jgi:hypothetical protein
VIRARFNVVQNFGQRFAEQTNERAIAALEAASADGAEVASRIASQRQRGPNPKMKNIRPVAVRPTETGYMAGFRSDAGISGEFYSGFQSRGTLGARTRKVKSSTLARRQSPSGAKRHAKVAGRKGITPLKHEETGLRFAKQSLINRLRSLA